MNEILDSAIETIEDTLAIHKDRGNHFIVKPLFTLGELKEILKTIDKELDV